MIAQRLKSLFRRVLDSRILRASSAVMIADGAATVLGLATSIVLARVLGAENYGLVILGMTLVNTITQFMDMQTGETLIRFMGNALARSQPREAITFFYVGLIANTVLVVITVAVVAVVVPPGASLYPDGEILQRLAGIYLLSVPFTLLEGVFGAMLSLFKRFNLLATVRIVNSLFLMLCQVAAAPQGVLAVMWAQVIAAAFSFVLWAVAGGWLVIRQVRTLRGENFGDAWRKFIPFTFHTSLTNSIKALSVNIDVLLLGAMRPVSEVTFFKIARSATGLLSIPTGPVNMVIYPEMNEAWARADLRRVRHLIKRYILYTLALSTVFYLLLGLAADRLVVFFYGQEYLPTAGVIRVIGIGIVLEAVFRWGRTTTLAGGKPQLATFFNIAGIMLRVVLAVPLIYFYGAIGAALAYDIAVLGTVLLITFYVMPRLGLWMPFGGQVTAEGGRDRP